VKCAQSTKTKSVWVCILLFYCSTAPAVPCPGKCAICIHNAAVATHKDKDFMIKINNPIKHKKQKILKILNIEYEY
jgi:hypothetical protein